MIQAMYSGVSGMKAFKASLDVIGNNIANVNTVGFKSAKASFKDMLSQTLSSGSAPSGEMGGTNPSQIGLGVMLGSVDVDNSQGSMTSTGRRTDVAIEGNGFFAVSNGTRTYYTRDGSFTQDAQYNLVTASSGMKLLGWSADLSTGTVDTSSPVTPESGIKVPVGGLSLASQTSLIDVGGNLDASAASWDPAVDATVPTDSQYTIKFDIYDSLGVTHPLTVQFVKVSPLEGGSGSADASWDYLVTSADGTVTPGWASGEMPAAPIVSGYSGNLAFDSKGYATSGTSSSYFNLVLTTPTGAVTPIETKIDLSKISQLNGAHTVDLTYQDGLPQGTLESYSMDRTGKVIGQFTNGASRLLGQVALAAFTNPSGLTKSGSNVLVESSNSGPCRLGVPGSGSLGRVSSGFLEASNVDLANEFASMIASQRGFQANSRIITTADEVLQELTSLKR